MKLRFPDGAPSGKFFFAGAMMFLPLCLGSLMSITVLAAASALPRRRIPHLLLAGWAGAITLPLLSPSSTASAAGRLRLRFPRI